MITVIDPGDFDRLQPKLRRRVEAWLQVRGINYKVVTRITIYNESSTTVVEQLNPETYTRHKTSFASKPDLTL